MMKYIVCFFMLLSSFLSVQAAVQKPVVAVYAGWKYPQVSAQQLPWSQFSHLAIASVYPLPDGSLQSAMVDQFITSLVATAHEHGKTVLLSVGGAGEGSRAFHQIMKNPATAAKFVANVTQYARRHQLDGIDIDWEYWTFQHQLQKGGRDPVESQQLTDLLKALRTSLGPDMLLTADIIAGDWLGAQYSAEIQQYVDYVNLMAFDFTGGWPESQIGHHADYATFVKAIKHTLAKGFMPEKLLIGLPAYGIEFIDGGKAKTRQIAYRDIVDLAGASPAILQQGKLNHIYFENKYLFAKKAKYLAKQNLAGYFMFDVGADHPDPELSLLHAAGRYITPQQNHE
jgi:chitinase